MSFAPVTKLTVMAVLAAPLAKRQAVPPLENGDRMSAREFLRRFEAMPELKKAELIGGVVHLPSPVRITAHAEADNAIQWWLKHYSIHTPGTKPGTNATTRLGPDDVPQPDALLRLLPACGGHARVDGKGYLQGAPELVAEIAASSVSIDVGEKLRAYRRAGVLEYLVWRTEDAAVDWWSLDQDEYERLQADEAGVLRSRVFPGLWLHLPALLADDGATLLATLEAGLKVPAHAAFVQELRDRRARSH
jgi:hypothetical protein